MTKKFITVLALALTGCGGGSTPDLPPEATINTERITYENLSWQVQIPSTWEVLPAQKQVLFMARNGDENFTILERALTTSSPAQQILSSAKQQFYDFNLTAEKPNAWQFSGKLNITSPSRTFWQKVEDVPNQNVFLLGSCSQHTGSPSESFCESILNSWQPLFKVSS